MKNKNMKNKNVVPVWVSVVLLALCAIGIARVVMMFNISRELSPEKYLQSVISSIICICAVVFALLYCFMGYKKSAAKIFLTFSTVLTLLVFTHANHYMVAAITAPDMPQGAIEGQYNLRAANLIGINCEIAPMILIFGILFTLTIAKDLGKNKSYWLIGTATSLSLIECIIISVSQNKSSNKLEIFCASGIEFNIFILCVIYGIMVYAKYQDKTARGTK